MFFWFEPVLNSEEKVSWSRTHTDPPVRLETGSSWSQVEQSTTEPLHSFLWNLKQKLIRLTTHQPKSVYQMSCDL